MPQPIPIAEIPPFLNDYRVIAALPLEIDNATMIVIVHRPGDDQPFVVAEWCREFRETFAERGGAIWAHGDYYADRTEAFQALLERARTPLPKPHDEGSAPPDGFQRFQIELDVPDGFTPDSMLPNAQQFAVDMIDCAGDDGFEHPGASVIDEIENRVIVRQMQG